MLKVENFNKYENKILWNITNICNLKCYYCIYAQYEKPFYYYLPDEIEKAFKNSGKQWLILFSGGEPFLYPNFLEILKRLSKNNFIQISTNLTTDNIYDLPNYLNPNRVEAISISWHSSELKKIKNGYDEFFKKYHFLKHNNYKTIVTIVFHPKIINIEEKINFLKNNGVDQIALISFRGIYNNMNYPDNYSDTELNLLSKFAIDNIELLIAKNQTNYFTHYCEAGKNYFYMNPEGNIQRCCTINKKYGNFFKNNFSPDKKIKPCSEKKCNDCYFGILSVKNEKCSRFNFYVKKIFSSNFGF